MNSHNIQRNEERRKGPRIDNLLQAFAPQSRAWIRTLPLLATEVEVDLREALEERKLLDGGEVLWE